MLQGPTMADAHVSATIGNLLAPERTLLIGGGWSGGSTADRLAIVDPSTERHVGDVVAAGPADVDDAVVAAEAAQRGWARIGGYERQRYLEALASAIEERAEDLALLESIDSGNPLVAMRDDVAIGVRQMRFLAAAGLSLFGRTIPGRGSLHYTVPEPYGVVARIIPFNHPVMFAITKIAAPLIAGNTVVLKPSEQAPLSSLLLGQIITDVLPAGVVNILTGAAATGSALVRHPRVKRIAFTGSAATGRAIQADAAAVGVKNVSLELGGKNPMVILPDADIASAVAGAVVGMNLPVCQGQSCGSNSRILVHESVFRIFQDKLIEALSALRVGVAYDDHTDMGPLVSENQYRRVMGYLDWARENDVVIAHGGGRPSGMEASAGYFVAPTVLSAPAPDSKIAQEEIFGPVVSLLPWSEPSEALRVANSVEYGLTASVWTRDVNRAHAWVEALEAGYVWVNEHGAHYVGTPFGGRKGSGTGREESLEEIESYCELKAVHMNFPDEL
jgi:2-formylbenzoate dehydrogenase